MISKCVQSVKMIIKLCWFKSKFISGSGLKLGYHQSLHTDISESVCVCLFVCFAGPEPGASEAGVPAGGVAVH